MLQQKKSFMTDPAILYYDTIKWILDMLKSKNNDLGLVALDLKVDPSTLKSWFEGRMELNTRKYFTTQLRYGIKLYNTAKGVPQSSFAQPVARGSAPRAPGGAAVRSAGGAAPRAPGGAAVRSAGGAAPRAPGAAAVRSAAAAVGGAAATAGGAASAAVQTDTSTLEKACITLLCARVVELEKSNQQLWVLNQEWLRITNEMISLNTGLQEMACLPSAPGQ